MSGRIGPWTFSGDALANAEQLQVEANGQASHEITEDDADDVWSSPTDLADLTLQCGRRGDSLKLFLSWWYYGTLGYASKIENAYSIVAYFADLVSRNENFQLVSENPPPCLQVCFYYAQCNKGRQSQNRKEKFHHNDNNYTFCRPERIHD
ncbi:glutamate decarboxylase [Exophiala aquamarina CBS 119918]|uniref:Glutamate decarboxylase n=1 Tax=Exophiala aquamarina CBS 119918 TaxID=1182545 RepID=A0A072P193_9EURO|nr:glutamate decarboxylase [Exophiala aquamarina CBS 119918]KEF53884.1 glutamate decarboxylase [Exophiala aquamarina CBS 119918]